MIHEENGQIIVDELRPMSDAPRDGKYITAVDFSGISDNHYEIHVKWNNEYGAWEEEHLCGQEESFSDAHFSGWIPMTIYRPKDGA